jgi:hypothetical protein
MDLIHRSEEIKGLPSILIFSNLCPEKRNQKSFQSHLLKKETFISKFKKNFNRFLISFKH